MQIPPELTFKTSTIADGNMSARFGDEAAVLHNREQFVGHQDYVCMRCNHGNTISAMHRTNGVAVTDTNNVIESEVLVTQTPGLTLMLLTADCLPTSFYDPVTHTIALAHFSRQTIAAELPHQTIMYLKQEFHVQPENLQVLVGPHIHAASYCFDDTNELFAPTIEPYVQRVDGLACVDLPAAHTAQLTAAGVLIEKIHYSTVNTFTSPDHFSHFESTRDDQKPHGRIATILSFQSAGDE